MGMTYWGTNGLFTHLGKLVKHYNQFKADATDAATGLDADRLDILDTFQAADQDLPIDGLVGAFERWKTEYTGRREELAGFALARLRDPVTVLKAIGASSTDQNEILFKLINQMIEDAETVEASAVSIGSVSAGGSNKGGGTILTTDVLDGVTSPGSINGVSMPAHPAYDGRRTELAAPDETFQFRVSADSFQDDVEEGSEEIAWEGQVPDEHHGIGTEGSGFVGTIQPVHAVTDQYLTNADFEYFTDNAPDDWDLLAGAAGTNIFSAGSAQASHGADALKLTGAGATSIKLKQDVAKTTVVARKRYCVTAKVKGDGATSGTLTIRFEGTGYAAGADEQIEEAVSALGTSYQLVHFFVNMPEIIPDDFCLAIQWSGAALGASEHVYLDDLGLAPVNYGAGIGVVAVRNSGPFVREDSYELTVHNTEATFQAFFRRAFGTQLPSCRQTSSSSSSGEGCQPTIVDSLAQ